MIKLLSSANSQEVLALQNALRRAGMPVTVTERGSTLELWLVQSSYEAAAREFIREYKANPPAEQPNQAPVANLGAAAMWQLLARQAGVFTFFIFAIIALVAVAQWFIAPDLTLSYLIFSPYGGQVLEVSQPWRWVTPIFLHFSATHLIFNLFWWWYLGGRLELTYGSATLVLVTIVTAVASNYAQWFMSGPLFGGLSGVVYGLLGFAMVVAWKRPWHPLALPPALLIFMIGWLLLGYTDLLWVNMANEAHSVGLLSGIALGILLRNKRPALRR